ncbi:SAM-dependent methyltransferase [Paenactinomyces guangxiensis]|uniref:50S rRNA methyltransferase n=1 Tax=Paenactinomyces guangxiensis TaxID=1490290 RepID=A0A7W1WQS9_9BACL|nr:SAM-dependent methyltransferase [Paenactinomyces guangxiensis]MBA4494302.1 50S rRNA methyltransferase [Paenactinomyces guangxiensis]MBH8590796.1 hypothetical protein [Paenactinomyces guangxiensis]
MRSAEMTDTFNLIMTVKAESLQAGLTELFAVDNQAKLEQWLDEGVGLVRLSRGFNRMTEQFLQKKPVFIQHLCPVHVSVKISNQRDDLALLLYHVQEMEHLLDPKKSFSVQTRFTGSNNPKAYKRFEVNETISNAVEALGYVLNVSQPEQVVSIVLSDERGYLGISPVNRNLSAWAGGKHRFAQEKGQISRAEFKLLEAIDVFDVPIPKHGTAIDLGAAPGGWTRVLLKYNFKVYAVDPAELHQSLKRYPQVVHFKETAQVFLKRHSGLKVDLIVNDMRMDVKESVSLMGEIRQSLKAGGYAIMTLKLQKKQIRKTVNQAIAQLERWYQILGVRQLFHNRSEVTVFMKQK